MTRVIVLVLVCLGWVPLAHAERARAPDPDAFAVDQEPETRVAGSAARRAPPPPSDVSLRRALARAMPEVRSCLVEAAGGARATARAVVSVDARRGISIRLEVRPRRAEACVDLAIRRYVQPLLSRGVREPMSATVQVAIPARAVVPPPPPPPPPLPPPPPPVQYDEAEVHAALDAMRASLIECVPDVSRGIAGQMTLRVSVRPDGSMTLMGVQLPTGVRGPGSLPCLASRVAWLRVTPPPGERLVVHHVELGR